MTDEDSFAGRVRRYARVGGAMAGLGARLGAERYLGVPIDRERHAADLKAALGGIKGPLMKVAQLLATIPDALPEGICPASWCSSRRTRRRWAGRSCAAA